MHSYGEDELVDSSELQADLEQNIKDGTVPHLIPTPCDKPDTVDVELGGKKKTCKCGATTHPRTSHRECPLNKKNIL